jgi:hypothetical protein
MGYLNNSVVTVDAILTTKGRELLAQGNFNITQLKAIAKNYKLKIGGNKNQLINRIMLIYIYPPL